ncbi:MAG: PAS domain-containing protein [Rhizobacter sp.]
MNFSLPPQPSAANTSAETAQDSLLRMAGRMAGLGGWTMDLPSMAVQWSDEVAALFGVPEGYTPEMESALDFVVPASRAQARDVLERCRLYGEPWDLELEIVTADGESRWVRSVGRAQRDSMGGINRLWGAIQDITRSKQAEAEKLATTRQLRDVSASLDMALSVAGLGVARLDLASDMAYFNENLCAILARPHSLQGYPRSEWLMVFHPDDRKAAEINTRRLLAGERTKLRSFRVVRPDGSVRYLLGQHSLQRDSAGTAVSTVLVVHDVTEQRESENARTAAAMAQQANFAKSEFLAHMSHELRTPLNAILGFAEILEADRAPALPPSHRKRVERIRSAGGHLLALINDLLDVSRIETGALRLQVTAVNLTDEVRQAIRFAMPQAQAREVTLEWAQQAEGVGDVWVHGDATRLRQVVLNLLTNAIKYNRPHGKVFINLTRSNDADVRLVVKDTGLGMNAQQLAQLFQPFNRLGKEHSTIEGTGIGLAITQHLVELMGGTVAVSSQLRVGSEFCMVLKLTHPPSHWRSYAQGDEAADERPTTGRTNTIAPPAEPHWSRVLYIEDNAVNRSLLQGYVGLRPGIALEMAVDGQSGIAAALRQKPDLILIDMMLPDLHGLQVIKQLRQVPSLQAVRCIAVSANAMPQQIQEAKAAGFDDYLTKPVSMKLLLAELDRLA